MFKIKGEFKMKNYKIKWDRVFTLSVLTLVISWLLLSLIEVWCNNNIIGYNYSTLNFFNIIIKLSEVLS